MSEPTYREWIDSFGGSAAHDYENTPPASDEIAGLISRMDSYQPRPADGDDYYDYAMRQAGAFAMLPGAGSVASPTASPVYGGDVESLRKNLATALAKCNELAAALDGGLCDHTFELQSMRNSIEALRLTGNENAVNCDGLPDTPHANIAFIRGGECPACKALNERESALEIVGEFRTVVHGMEDDAEELRGDKYVMRAAILALAALVVLFGLFLAFGG